MRGGVFFDSNVLIYTLAKNDSREPTAARPLAAGGTISVKVLNELADVARRRCPPPSPPTRRRSKRAAPSCSLKIRKTGR